MPTPSIVVEYSNEKIRARPIDGRPSKSFSIHDKDAWTKAEAYLESLGQLELYKTRHEGKKRPKVDHAATADSSLVPSSKAAEPSPAASGLALAGSSVAASDHKPSPEALPAVVDVEAQADPPRSWIPVKYSTHSMSVQK